MFHEISKAQREKSHIILFTDGIWKNFALIKIINIRWLPVARKERGEWGMVKDWLMGTKL